MIVRWFRLHAQSLTGAFGRLGATPLGALLNVLVVAIALALPAAMQVLLVNVGSMAPAFEDAADFTVYLELTVDRRSSTTVTPSPPSRPSPARKSCT